MKKHQNINIFRKIRTKYIQEIKKSTFFFENKRKIYLLIFKVYKSKLVNTFMFYLKLSSCFDNNVLKLF